MKRSDRQAGKRKAEYNIVRRLKGAITGTPKWPFPKKVTCREDDFQENTLNLFMPSQGRMFEITVREVRWS